MRVHLLNLCKLQIKIIKRTERQILWDLCSEHQDKSNLSCPFQFSNWINRKDAVKMASYHKYIQKIPKIQYASSDLCKISMLYMQITTINRATKKFTLRKGFLPLICHIHGGQGGERSCCRPRKLNLRWETSACCDSERRTGIRPKFPREKERSSEES